MPVEREKILNDVVESFSELERIVKARQALGHTSILQNLEIFFRDLLNLFCGWNLTDANFQERNAPGIDLVDSTRGLALQVTADTSAAKVKKTLQAVGEYRQGKSERLIMIYPQIKVSPTKANLSSYTAAVPFDPREDQWDLGRVLQELKNHATDTETLLGARNFLRTEIPKYSGTASTMVGPQVRTIIELIEVMIDDAQIENLEYEELAPNQDRKFTRFVEHAGWLQNQWKDHRDCYLTVEAAKRACSLDVLRGRRLASFLRSRSRKILEETGDDPQSAFELLTSQLLATTSTASNEPDEMAIRYFLADQLVACNIFPNEDLPGS